MSATERFYNVQYGTVCNKYYVWSYSNDSYYWWENISFVISAGVHIAEESEWKLEMSSMELHKEIQGYITGKLYFNCTF